LYIRNTEGRICKLNRNGYVLLLYLLIAGLDEFYQGFVPGRNSAVIDSLIDFGGAFMGMVMYVGIGRFKS